jgi:uncharacterized membrane protein YeiH
VISPNIALLQFIVEIIATLAFALSGLIAGFRKKLDPVGICMVAGVTAFGGGTLRDILLDRRPFFWVENSYWLWVLIGVCLLSTFFMKRRHVELTERAIQIPDALGLGLFTTLGTQIALEQNMPMIVAVLMGVVTAVFGGVLRDIVCNEIPQAFSDHRPNAIFGFMGSLLFIGLVKLDVFELVAVLVSFLFITSLRILAIYKDWRLPKWQG